MQQKTLSFCFSFFYFSFFLKFLKKTIKNSLFPFSLDCNFSSPSCSGGGQISLEVLDRWSGPEGSSVVIKKGGQVVQETTREHRLTAWIKDVEDQLEQGAVQVKELQLELASAKQELMSTRQEVVQAREESMKMKEMAMQSNDKYLLALKEKEKALRQKELVLRQLQLDRFEQQK